MPKKTKQPAIKPAAKSQTKKPKVVKSKVVKPQADKPQADKPQADKPLYDRWLLKSEPDAFSWEQQKSRGRKGEPWEGVRNFQARNNMRAMQIGDLGFFYHSNDGLEVVGVVEVCALAHPDASDETGKWDCVDVRAVADMPKPVSLADAKANPKLADMALVTSTRLSVQPVTRQQWDEVCRMGGLDPARLDKGK